MRNFFIIIFYVARAILKLLQPDGANSLIAENIALRQQLIIANRRVLPASLYDLYSIVTHACRKDTIHVKVPPGVF